MSECLIIFIDGLPFFYMERMPHLSRLPERYEITPGFGYSVNIHAELFGGYTPDEIGYFGEWMLNFSRAPGRRWHLILPLLDRLFRPYPLNRGLQRIITLGYKPDHIMPNIPLRHIDKFSAVGENIHSPNFPRPTLFTMVEGLVVLNPQLVANGERDGLLYRKGLALIEKEVKIYLPLPDLDGVGHLCGVGSAEYEAKIAELDVWVEELANRFMKLRPRGQVFVISDHGMANVKGGVYLDIEEGVGRAGRETYLYFTDATLLRVWTFNESFKARISSYLADLGYGRIISSEERTLYGLTSPRFGDIIFILNEGFAFEPSFFARSIPRAMHGYHPELLSQKGVLLHMGHQPLAEKPKRATSVFRILKEALLG